MRGLILGSLLLALGQSMIWFQTNGQFIWPWFKKNPLVLSIFGGTAVSYIFIIATGLVAEHFNGALWPGRFIGFTLGIISFTTLTYLFMGEGVTTKTTICLVLAFGIICVQIFWK